MLQTIHDKAKGWIAYAIIIFITVPFALWGINQYTEGGGKRVAAVVNGEEIPSQQVQTQLLDLKQRVPPQLATNDDLLKPMALDAAINQVLLRQLVKEFGFRASNEEIAQTIAKDPKFQVNGKFDPTTYTNRLTAQGIDPGYYEAQQREMLTQNQLQAGVDLTGFVPLAMANQYQALQGQEREIETFTLKADNFKPQVQIAETAINDYYEKNKLNFMTDERVKLAYLDLDKDKLAESITVNPADVQAYYDSHKDMYINPEMRSLSHIVVSIAEPAGPDQEKAAKDKATQLAADIKAGKITFEQAAREKSDDKTAAAKDGAMGDITQGDVEPEFGKVVFGLAQNVISEPTKTNSGFEILKVTAIKPATPRTFEEAKADVEKDFRRDTSEKQAADKIDQLNKLAFESSGDLAPAAQATGLPIQETDWISKTTNTGIGALPAVKDAAFSDEVKNGKNSSVLEVGNNRALVVRSIAREEAKQRSLAEVKETIIQTLTAQEARKLAAQRGADLVKQLSTGKDWAPLETAYQGSLASIQKPGFIKRAGGATTPEVTSKAFAMPKPAEGVLSWDGVELGNGDYAIVSLKAVKDGEVKENLETTQSFGRMVSGRELNAMLQALRDTAKIERFPENI